jgi:hypothetical protein
VSPRAATFLGVVMAAAMLVHPDGAGAAGRSARMTLTASATRVSVGDSVTLVARVPGGRFARGDHVAFQRRTGSRWLTVSRTRLGGSGRTSTTVHPRAGSTSYRVVSPRTAKPRPLRSRSVRVTATRAPTLPPRPVQVQAPEAPPAGSAEPPGPTEPSRTSVLTVNGPGRRLDIDEPGATPEVVVDLAAADKIAITATDLEGISWSSPVVFTMRDSSGTIVPLDPATVAQPELRTVVAPTSGRYTIAVEVGGGQTGSLVLVVSSPLSVATVPDGTARAVAAGVPGRGVRATFTSTAGDYVTWHVDEITTWRTGAILVDLADGSRVEQAGSGLWKVPRTGSYRLEFQPTFATVLTAALSVSSAPPRPLALNGPTTLATVRGGSAQVYAFSASAGDPVTVAASEIDRPDSTRYSVEVVDPEGHPYGGFLTPYDLTSFTAPTTGTHLVVVGASGTGSVSLRLDVTTPVRRAVVLDGPSVRLSSEERAGQELQAVFTAQAGDYVSYAVSGQSFGPTNPTRQPEYYTALVDVATGATVDTVDSRETGVHRIPTTGTYRLRYQPAGAFRASFDLLMSSARPTPLAIDGPTRDVAIERPGAAKVYAAEVIEGQTIAVTASGASRSLYRVHISGAGATAETGSSQTSATLTADRTGTVILVVTGPVVGGGTVPLRLDVRTAR